MPAHCFVLRTRPQDLQDNPVHLVPVCQLSIGGGTTAHDPLRFDDHEHPNFWLTQQSETNLCREWIQVLPITYFCTTVFETLLFSYANLTRRKMFIGGLNWETDDRKFSSCSNVSRLNAIHLTLYLQNLCATTFRSSVKSSNAQSCAMVLRAVRVASVS